MVETTVVRTIRVKGTSEGVEKLTGELTKLAGAQENVAVVSEQSARRSLSVEAAYKKLVTQVDENARAQDRMARAQKDADAAVRQGFASQAEANRNLDLLAQKYGLVDAAARKMVAGMSAAGDVGAVASQRMVAGLSAVGRAADEAARAQAAAAAAGPSRLIGGMSAAGDVNAVASQRMLAGMSSGAQQAAQGIGLARHELINLSRQAQDIGVQLVSGQSPLMILAQQGTQIADIFIASGKSVGGFFSQAISWATAFAKTPAGIVTGIAAIGAAAVYAASQFVRASTTIEEALETQNRLLKEGKALIDARTSAEARSQLQPKELTQFEVTRNLLDLQNKLNKAREEAERSVSRPTEVPGEMGFAPTAVTGLKDFTSAFEVLNNARAAGLPGLKDFIAELGKIGQARPDLANKIADMIKDVRPGVGLELAEMQLRAINDQLNGIATNAQMAAVGFGSLAQYDLTKLRADEAKEATEALAVATLQLKEIYPGISAAMLPQVHALDQQLQLTQARTDAERASILYNQTIANAHLQQRGHVDAIAIATRQRALTEAQVNAAAAERLRDLRNENELIRAGTEEERARLKARQEYDRLIGNNVDPSTAGAIAAQMQSNARATRDLRDETVSWSVANEEAGKAARRAAEATNGLTDAQIRAKNAAIAYHDWLYAFIPSQIPGLTKMWEAPSGQKTQFNPAGYQSMTMTPAGQFANNVYGAGGFDPNTGAPNAQGLANMVNTYLGGGRSMGTASFAPGGGIIGAIEGLLGGSTRGGGGTRLGGGGIDPNTLQVVQRLTQLLPKEQQAGVIERELAMLRASPQTIERDEMIMQLTQTLDQLRQSTDNLNGTMQSVLSEYYNSDPRTSHLGFRTFAQGGIMTAHGELPLKRYQLGGVVRTPQVAIYGEGSTPEAIVPIPNGHIPVRIMGAANNNQRPVVNHINVSVPNGSRRDMKRGAQIIAQEMTRAMASAR